MRQQGGGILPIVHKRDQGPGDESAALVHNAAEIDQRPATQIGLRRDRDRGRELAAQLESVENAKTVPARLDRDQQLAVVIRHDALELDIVDARREHWARAALSGLRRAVDAELGTGACV